MTSTTIENIKIENIKTSLYKYGYELTAAEVKTAVSIVIRLQGNVGEVRADIERRLNVPAEVAACVAAVVRAWS